MLMHCQFSLALLTVNLILLLLEESHSHANRDRKHGSRLQATKHGSIKRTTSLQKNEAELSQFLKSIVEKNAWWQLASSFMGERETEAEQKGKTKSR